MVSRSVKKVLRWERCPQKDFYLGRVWRISSACFILFSTSKWSPCLIVSCISSFEWSSSSSRVTRSRRLMVSKITNRVVSSVTGLNLNLFWLTVRIATCFSSDSPSHKEVGTVLPGCEIKQSADGQYSSWIRLSCSWPHRTKSINLGIFFSKIRDTNTIVKSIYC